MEKTNNKSVVEITNPATHEDQHAKRGIRYLYFGFLPLILFGYIVSFQVGMFVQRYQSDLKIIDLQDKIRQQQAIITIAAKQQLLNDQPTEPTPTSAFSIYSDKTYKFSFTYPDSIQVQTVTPTPVEKQYQLPKPIESIALGAQPSNYNGMMLNIYPTSVQSPLTTAYPIQEPCGSQYGKTEKNEMSQYNGISVIHREMFCMEDIATCYKQNNDGTLTHLGDFYGTREDYCFVTGSGNLAVFSGSTETLNAGMEQGMLDMMKQILPTLRSL